MTRRRRNPIRSSRCTSLSATSLDVVRHYAAAQEASVEQQVRRRAAEPARRRSRSIRSSASAIWCWPASRGTCGSLEDAQKYIKEALQHLDGMTERERFTTRGMFYRLTGDYQQCVKEHGELIARYAADVVGHNQLALCASQLRDLTARATRCARSSSMLPKRALFRDNLVVYSNYAGDFETGEKEARTPSRSRRTSFADARAGVRAAGQGDLGPAGETFTKSREARRQGRTGLWRTRPDAVARRVSAISRAYEGRFGDAVRILEQGAAADLGGEAIPIGRRRSSRSWPTRTSLQGQKAAAVAAAEKALANSKAVKIRFLAARTFVEAGQPDKAAALDGRTRRRAAGRAAGLREDPRRPRSR